MAIWSDNEFQKEQAMDLPDPKPDLTGKVILVTGGSSGIGFEAAKKFAQLGAAKVIITCRSISSGEDAAKTIQDGAKGVTEVIPWYVDFTKLDTVKSIAQKARTELSNLDILVSNAAVHYMFKSYTGDDLDMSLQVNNIASSYLIYSVLPLLRKSSDPRAVLVTSSLHWTVKELPTLGGDSPLWTFNAWGDNKNDERPYAPYNYTKAINVLDCGTFTDLEPGVKFTTVNPGLCVSNLGRNMAPERRQMLQSNYDNVGWTTEKGSRNLVWAATADVPCGSYVTACHVEEKSDLALSEDGKKVAKSIWDDYQQIWKDKGLL